MSASNLDSFDLKSVDVGGLINEDVMQQIWDISGFPLDFTDMAGNDTHKNERYEWTQDDLAAASTTNKTVDGDDVDQDDSRTGLRVGNHSQTSVKSVKVSYRAIESDTIGRANELIYQVSKRLQELKRDVEASSLSNNASIAGTDVIAGQSAGLDAWIATNVAEPAVGYVAGGFNTSTGLVDAMTPGTSEANSETKVRDTAQAIYEEGGNATVIMARPKVIRKFSEYLFGSTSVARIQSDTGENTNPVTAKGSVNVFVSDFGSILRFVPNRLQPTTAANQSTMFILDPMHVKLSYLQGYRTDELAKTGLSEKRLMSVDYTLVVTTEKAHGKIVAIDEDAAVIA